MLHCECHTCSMINNCLKITHSLPIASFQRGSKVNYLLHPRKKKKTPQCPLHFDVNRKMATTLAYVIQTCVTVYQADDG